MGWHGRLYAILSRLCDERVTGEHVFVMEDARASLLKAHLWLQAFQAEQGDLPDSWAEVVAAKFPQMPIDPWDPAEEPLRYRRTEDGYVLYSVGPNQVDDGGATPNADDMPGLPQTGDLRLDVLYGPEPATSQPTSG
jgi:hypothetical protein